MNVEKMRQMSDEELIELARQLHESIYVFDCYGVSDLLLYYAVLDELRKRGYTIETVEKLVIEKAEDEDE
jgi:hypothetical protein